MTSPTPAAPASGLDLLHPALRAVAMLGTERRYRKGAILMEEGDPGGTLYFIASGQLRAYTATAEGQEFTFGHYGPGEYLGEMSLDGEPRSASVVVESAAVCRIVSRATLEACIQRDPQVTFQLLGKVVRMVRSLSVRARDLALHDAYGRLAQLLRAQAIPQPDGSAWMPLTLTQAQLAQQLGCSRTMVTKLLGDLTSGGYLQLDQKRWRVMLPLPNRW